MTILWQICHRRFSTHYFVFSVLDMVSLARVKYIDNQIENLIWQTDVDDVICTMQHITAVFSSLKVRRVVGGITGALITCFQYYDMQ